MVELHVTIHGRDLLPPIPYENGTACMRHIAALCPQCGEIWARIRVSRPTTWIAIEFLCPHHGGIYRDLPYAHVIPLPREFLTHDFLTLMEQRK